MSATLLAWGRLLRLSLAPSALADAASGIVLGTGVWPGGPAPWLLLSASACVYHGGMALNDWADRAEDARHGRGRPLQSGAVRAPTALVIALSLLSLGPVIAWLSAPRCGLALGSVALCATLYDLAGRGPFRGPALLGLCRAGNLAGGLALASTHLSLHASLLAAPLAYGVYVFLVSRVALLEDAGPGVHEARPARRVAAMAAGLGAIGLVAAWTAFHLPGNGQVLGPWLAAGLPFVLAGLGSLGLWRCVAETSWQVSELQRVAGMGLRRLLVASATLALGAGTRDSLVVALAILCGYPLSYGLRRVFPPT